jgi:rare lipoprotein A
MKAKIGVKAGQFVLMTILVMSFGFRFHEEKKPIVLSGIASYYSDYYIGRTTSNGEKFSQDSLTAASKDLKFGTYVRITNLKNDSVVVVRINDRMPQWNKRLIDLSTRAAKQLNFIKAGLAKVKVEILEREGIRS